MIDREIRLSLFQCPTLLDGNAVANFCRPSFWAPHFFVLFMTTKTQYFEYEIAHAMLQMKCHASPPTEQKARTTKLKLKDTAICVCVCVYIYIYIYISVSKRFSTLSDT